MDQQPTKPAQEPSNEPDAIFASAREMLADPKGAGELQRGIAMMEEVAAEGCAAATELLALFEAMGIARPQNWGRALDLLQLAAESGSESAGKQLLLLADPTMSWEGIEAVGESDWAQIRASISLDHVHADRERSSLSEEPRIRVIEGFATPSECRWLMERARPRLARATVLKKTGAHGVAEGRTNTATTFQIVDMDVVIEAIRARISTATRVPLPLFEPTQVFRYSVSQEFRLHHDFLDPANPAHRAALSAGQRIATFVLYLNEDFEGGQTDFPAVGVRYRGGTGDAIFWANVDRQNRPDRLTVHAGLPPTAGEKWVLSQWIRDRAGSPAGRA